MSTSTVSAKSMGGYIKRALCLSLLLCASINSLIGAEYEISMLPNFQDVVTLSSCINDQDVIAGSFFNKEEGNVHAFQYDLNKQQLIDLGTLSNEEESRAVGINNAGTITGTSGDQTFIGSSQSGLQPIGFSNPLPSKDPKSVFKPTACLGVAINQLGELCGSQVFQNERQEACERPMFYNMATGVIDLGLPKDTIGNGAALGLNSLNTVVGVVYDSANVGRSAMWKLGKGKDGKKVVKSIVLLDGFESHIGETIAFAINDSRQVIGTMKDDQDRAHAFLWTKQNGPIDLGMLPGDDEAIPQAINNEGVVVGISCNVATGKQRVFAWTEKTGMLHLGLTSTTTDLSVTSINEAGDVTVFVEDRASFLIKTNNMNET